MLHTNYTCPRSSYHIDSEWSNHIDSLCRWLGLILLPIVSFAADGAIAILYFFRSIYHHYFQTPIEPISLARARAIDLSVQFALFWMPVFVLVAWWSHKPLSLLFDLFEVAVLVGSIFLVNYITADGKTNWAEGCAMVGFYAIIVSVSFHSSLYLCTHIYRHWLPGSILVNLRSKYFHSRRRSLVF